MKLYPTLLIGHLKSGWKEFKKPLHIMPLALIMLQMAAVNGQVAKYSQVLDVTASRHLCSTTFIWNGIRRWRR